VYHRGCEQCNILLSTLGLDPQVTFQQIADTHRDLVQVWHPDRFEHNPLSQKAEDSDSSKPV
jgi:curved DNA-binding protein CbpA